MSDPSSPAATPKISICIVTFGALEWVQRAIAAVRDHTSVDYELIVVDNGSPDGTRAWLREHLSPDEYIESPCNTGFAGGNNLAVNQARAPFLCLLNSDAIVPVGWAEPLLEALERNPDLGIAVPMLTNADGSVQEVGCNVDADGYTWPLFLGASPFASVLQSPRTVTYGSAACWVLRTTTYRRLGGLDCGFGRAYYEDVDFAFTVQEHGMEIQCIPGVRVMHAQGASSSDRVAAEQLREAQRHRFVGRHATELAHHSHVFDLEREPHRYFATRDANRAWRTLEVFDAAADLHARVEAIETEIPRPDHQWTLICTPDDDHRVSTEPRGSAHVEILHHTDTVVVLQDRLFHFSEIVAPRAWLTTHHDTITANQPQARIEEMPSDGSHGGLASDTVDGRRPLAQQ